jgi:hypothetical protein
MLRRIPLKAWIGIGAVAIVAVVAVIVAVVIKDEPEAYRTIKVYEYTGSAQVIRGEGKVIDVYNSMRLESGDKLVTGKESYLQLKLDDDKYILLESETEIRIVAEGNKKDSKTKISLEKGAVVNCIEDKLSGSSEYNVETPNSTMAVRGTTFRVQIKKDETGESYATVSVFEGNVASKLIYPDGTVEEKELDVETGKAVKILGTSADTMYVTIDEDIDYKELELEVLEFLDKSQENGKDLSISKEELNKLIDEIISMNKEEETESESTTEEVKDTELETTSEQASELETTTNKVIENDSEKETNNHKEETTTKVQQTTVQQTTVQQTTVQQTTVQQTTEEQTTEEPTTVLPEFYVVTFMYNGQVFATQEVKPGARATCPKLSPARMGDWNYDFTKAVNSNVTVEWVEE